MTTGTSINDPRRSLPAWQEAAGTRPTPFDPGAEGSEYMERRAASGPSREGDRPGFTVGEVMTRNARSCRPGDRLAAAALAMCEGDCRFLPVLDRMGHPIGVITDGDICLVGSTDRRSLREILVREVMSGLPATCRAADDVLDAIKIMRERRIRHLPVVNAEGLLEGVVSVTDLVLCAEDEDSSRLRQEVAAALHGRSRRSTETTGSSGTIPSSRTERPSPGRHQKAGYVSHFPAELLPGAMVCGVCGAAIAKVSGKSGGYYGCPGATKGQCQNRLYVWRTLAERVLLAAVREKLGSEDNLS